MHIFRSLYAAAALALALVAAAPASAQSVSADSQAVAAVVHQLFDAMRAGDSAAVRSVFHPEAQLATTMMRQGAPVVEFDSIGMFVRAVGTPHDEVWDERLRSETIRLDDGLASVWTEYSFYAGETFSHCGVNSFHLARTAEGWKIIGLVDTRRKEGCPDQ